MNPHVIESALALAKGEAVFRADSKMMQLAEVRPAEFAEVVEMLDSGTTPKDVAAHLAKLPVPSELRCSQSKLYAWWSRFRGCLLRARRRDAAHLAKASVESSEDARDFDAAIRLELQQSLFEALTEKGGSEEMAKALLTGFVKLRTQEQDRERLTQAKALAEAEGRRKDKALELAERRVALLEKQASEAKDALADSRLSDAEKAARIREIFGK